MLSQQAITDFTEIYKKEFGEELTFEDAQTRAINFLLLFKIVYRPIKKQWLNELARNDQEKSLFSNSKNEHDK